MPLLGSAAMLLSFDVEPDWVEEHDRWHTHEHLPERLSIPGFRRGTRWVSTTGAPRYMVLYEVAELAVLSSPAYLARLNQPSAWTSRVMPHYRGMVRGLCAVRGSFGHGHGGAAALLRFRADGAQAEALRRWLLEEVLPGAAGDSGLGAAHLLEGAQAAAMTNEQRLRGADGGVDSAVVVTGYDPAAVARFVASLCEPAALPARGAAALSCATYRLAYALTSQGFA